MMDRTHTESLCPSCLKRIPARRAIQDSEVYLEKTCPEHGPFRTRIWKGQPEFEAWCLPKIPVPLPVVFREIDQGCPFDCGLCPDHRQQSCTILLEVTRRCDLGCPVCYADTRAEGDDPSLEVIAGWFLRAKEAAGNCNVQLSGGEPTLRDDLPKIVAEGKRLGFEFIQLNTNGLRLAWDRAFVKALKEAGLSSVFLQFDGTDEAVYRRLRGRPMLNEKQEAIATCGENGIGVVLVPTLVPGLNTDNIGAILQTALDHSPVVRGVHFQPISYFGRFIEQPSDDRRFTLPELMEAIEVQSKGTFRTTHFRPPGCENALCSFHGHYLVGSDQSVQSLHGPFESGDSSSMIQADQGAARAVAYVARQWTGAQANPVESLAQDCCSSETKGNDLQGCCPPPGLMGLDDFLARARQHLFSISAMAFQDVWNITLDRVRDCCIHVMSPKGTLIPFCLYNLTGLKGNRLYRPL
jgi:7,8-dihydro-6-hydroxymethylpterin dimethyltransferase